MTFEEYQNESYILVIEDFDIALTPISFLASTIATWTVLVVIYIIRGVLLVDVGIELLENISRRFEDDFQDFIALKGWLDLFLIVRFFLILW